VIPPYAPADVTGVALGPRAEGKSAMRGLFAKLRLGAGLAALGLLAACASHNSHLSASQQASEYKDNARGSYAPPGPPSDPWGPYVVEASRRFDVPPSWIRNVMHVESGGNLYVQGQLVTSGVGAMGLMQLMPQTYQELESQYGLGDDPYNPHDNIMAGTAYLREMYDLFGSPGFLAAYNAGPQRLNQYLTDGRPLPAETTHYLAMIEPNIQGDMPTGRSPADQFAMNSMTAPSAAPYNGGAPVSSGPTLADTGGGLVTAGRATGSLPAGGSQGDASALLAMNDSTDSEAASTDALNAQQVAQHGQTLVANGGGAVPPDLMVAHPEAAPVVEAPIQTASVITTPLPSAQAQQQLAYQPAVVEATPVASAAAPLPARQPVFQVAPAYQSAQAPAAAVPVGTRLAQNTVVQTPYAPAPATYQPSVIGPGGTQNLAAEVRQPARVTYQPRQSGGLHLIAPAEADTLPASVGGGSIGGWGIQVGAYGTPNDARHAIDAARHTERMQLASARTVVMAVQVSQRTLYRARLSGLSQNAAVNACQGIQGRTPCMVLSPDALTD